LGFSLAPKGSMVKGVGELYRYDMSGGFVISCNKKSNALKAHERR